MQILPPFDKIGVTPPPLFVNASPQAGIAGSIVNGLIFNALQTELQNSIAGLGLTPTDSDYTQLLQTLLLGGGLFVGNFSDSSDAYSASIPGSVTVPALKAGMRVVGFITTANTTATPSLAIAGFTTGSAAAPIKRKSGGAPAVGDVAVTLTAFRFDGTNWRIDGIVQSDVAGWIGNSPVVQQAITTYLAGSGGGSGSSGAGTFGLPFHADIYTVNNSGAPTSKRDITIARCEVPDGTGNTATVTGFSGSIDYTTTGFGGMDSGTISSIPANSKIYDWLVCQAGGANQKVMGSLSATAPTIPSGATGYTFALRISEGAILDSSNALYSIEQYDNEYWYVAGVNANTPGAQIVASGAIGTYATTKTGGLVPAAVNLSTFLSPNAKAVTLKASNCFNAGGSNTSAIVMSNPNEGGHYDTNFGGIGLGSVAGQDDIKTWRWALNKKAFYVWAASLGGPFGLAVCGFST